MDLRNVFLITFKNFGSRQGKRLADTGTFDRYIEIANRTKGRYKDPKTLKCVEWILENDFDNFPMSRWLLEKNADVKSVKKYMEISSTEADLDIYEKVIKMEMSPKDAVAEIERRDRKSNSNFKSFSLPDKQTHVAEIYNGEPEEVLVNLENNSVSTFFFEPDKYTYSDPIQKDYYGKPTVQAPEIYGTKVGVLIKPFVGERLKEGGSGFVAVTEVYHKGFAMRIPENVIRSVEKETGLIYKQTLFQTDDNSFTEKKSARNMPDSVTHLLWFVKSKDKETFNSPSLIIKNKTDRAKDERSLSPAYMTCSNHLNSQSIGDLIFKGEGKNAAGHSMRNLAAIIPIYVTSEQDDLVVDLSMKSDIAAAAILMNRRFIGVAKSKKVFESASKKMAVAIDNYDSEMAQMVLKNYKKSKATPKLNSQEAA